MRQLVIGGRQVGKTRELLERMIDGDRSDYVYIASTARRAQDAYDAAVAILSERGTTWDESVLRRFRARFKTWEQAADPMYYGTRRAPVLIDDVDQILAQLFGDVDTATTRPPQTVRSIFLEGNPHD